MFDLISFYINLEDCRYIKNVYTCSITVQFKSYIFFYLHYIKNYNNNYLFMENYGT